MLELLLSDEIADEFHASEIERGKRAKSAAAKVEKGKVKPPTESDE